MRLKDKIAIVTGSGQGIGREIALAFAREGAKVVVSDITDEIFRVVKEIEAIGSEALAAKCDVSKPTDVKNLAKLTIERFGRIDILVNNAGIYPSKAFLEMTESDWDKVLNVNLKGAFNCTRSIVPQMVKQRYGKIVNISSIAGTAVGFAQRTHYSASKAGIAGFTRALALELAPYGINVNAIAPGYIETPGTQGMAKETYDQIKKAIPIGRWGEPIDVAALAAFLASDDSSFITGQIQIADGGYTLQ